MNQNHLKLRGKMREKGLTIADIARKVGLSGSYISNILCGRFRPSIDLAYDIIKAAGADPSEIYNLFPPKGEDHGR
ncbi:MAG: helix-turn-helix transcriptional regulator [Christensenella sp.]|nr:helix-turn-helix transcriptional regulator [Christensenella sp.]